MKIKPGLLILLAALWAAFSLLAACGDDTSTSLSAGDDDHVLPQDDDTISDDDDTAGDDDMQADDDIAVDDDDSEPPYSDTLIVHHGDLYLHGERFIIKSIDFTVPWPEDREICSTIMDQIVSVGANSFRFCFELEHDIFELAKEKGLYVMPLFFNSWLAHMPVDEIRDLVNEFEHHENLLAWIMGNEVWGDDLTIPVDLLTEQYQAVLEEDDFHRPVIYGNHMALNHPILDQIPVLPERGYGPIDFVDVIGWNPYPFFRALSLSGMIGVFWESVRPYIENFSPMLAAMIDVLFDWYEQWAQNMPDWLYDNAFGMDLLLKAYADNADKQNWDGVEYHPKPWILTEWGFTDSPNAIENDFTVIKIHLDYRSLDGFNYHHWMWLDIEPDGILDVPEAYDKLVELFGLVQ